MRYLVLLFNLFQCLIHFGQVNLSHHKICDLPTEVKESSGLAVVNARQIWTHSDSGYDNELFLVDSNGFLLRTVVVENALNIDWEDLSWDIDSNLWINDAGNNSNYRTNLVLYRINKEDLKNKDTVNADRIITFNFPDQPTIITPNNVNFDIEAIFHFKDSVFLITKNRSQPTNGFAKLYSVPDQSGTFVATLRDSFFVDEDNSRSRITAADFHFNANKMAMLTRTQIIEFWNFSNTDIFKGEVKRYFFSSRTNQVEGLGFLDENTFYMTDEGSPNNQVNGGWYVVKKEEKVSTNKKTTLLDISIHWNPFSKKWKIESFYPERTMAVLTDLNGRVILEQEFQYGTVLSGNSLPQGIYLLIISGENFKHVCKVFVN